MSTEILRRRSRKPENAAVLPDRFPRGWGEWLRLETTHQALVPILASIVLGAVTAGQHSSGCLPDTVLLRLDFAESGPMSDNRPFEAFRLSVMQDVLPVGLAMVERVRQGGASKVVEGLTSSSDPLAICVRKAPAARAVRERLEQVSPGLGNPVVQVDADPTRSSRRLSETRTVDAR